MPKRLIYLILILCSGWSSRAQPVVMSLNEGWQFKSDTALNYTDIKVPGTIFESYLKQNYLLDPFFETNLDSLAKLANQEYTFLLYINPSYDLFTKKLKTLRFEGLDTYCTISLNGKKLGTTYDAFKSWEFDVSQILERDGNMLTLTFHNNEQIADSLYNAAEIKLPEGKRQYIRKPAYQFGWDFVPPMLSVGITGKIFLIGSDGPYSFTYPAKPPMATFDSTNFVFYKNNKPIFIKGVNLVPPPAYFIPSESYYDSLIHFCKKAHINMIRVWGGGSIPPDYFYTLCDSAEIMVWQDLPFANGLYPADLYSRYVYMDEVRDIVKRLRKHPCIVLWCGNNEIDEGWHNWGWQKKYTSSQVAELSNNYNYIFKEDLPIAIASEDKSRPYIHSSPRYGWGEARSLLEGDSHYWAVWWGMAPYKNYQVNIPRFMSEYGIQALPDIHSIHQFCSAKNISTDSVAFTYHQRNTSGFEKIRHYLKSYPAPKTDTAYIYFTQVMQRDAITTAIAAHRSAQPYCNGTMLWQFNDSWPGITWSILDYYNRPKASYYALDSYYGNNLISVNKLIYNKQGLAVDTQKFPHTITLCDPDFDLTQSKTDVFICDVYGDTVYKFPSVSWTNNGSDVWYIANLLDKNLKENFRWNNQYLVVKITTIDNKVYQKPLFLCSEPKDLQLEEPAYSAVQISDSLFEIQAKTLIKDIYLFSDDPKTRFSDNYFTLLPEEKKMITITNYNPKKPIRIYSWLDMISQ